MAADPLATFAPGMLDGHVAIEIAIVTGGGRGIGRRTALAMAGLARLTAPHRHGDAGATVPFDAHGG